MFVRCISKPSRFSQRSAQEEHSKCSSKALDSRLSVSANLLLTMLSETDTMNFSKEEPVDIKTESSSFQLQLTALVPLGSSSSP